ncbi:MAG TPA: T9SS type A sorting domain-containing protein, partial [Ignavibacteriaceae bacterium]|nr:T9SS type A sorting domain-containing protein [Ignavibacteriaceae bacterium]
LGITTSVDENNITNVFTLEQNYPNPFNPSTKINFSLINSEYVTLKVYDILGKEIASLVNEEKPAGSYGVEFNAAEVSSGIYFYKLQAENFIDVKKMMLIK